jgi:hypothetical protein
VNVYRMSPEEIYETFAGQADPQELVEQGRATLTADLMVKEGLLHEVAFYAADQLLEFAQTQLHSQEGLLKEFAHSYIRRNILEKAIKLYK